MHSFPTENTSAMLVVPFLGTRSPLVLRLLYRFSPTPVLLVYVCFCLPSMCPAVNRRNHSPSPEVQEAIEVVASTGIVLFHCLLCLSFVRTPAARLFGVQSSITIPMSDLITLFLNPSILYSVLISSPLNLQGYRKFSPKPIIGRNLSDIECISLEFMVRWLPQLAVCLWVGMRVFVFICKGSDALGQSVVTVIQRQLWNCRPWLIT
ncbi:hypothetical protein BDV10DRAFT_114895 [Aspergillus recurvatus]